MRRATGVLAVFAFVLAGCGATGETTVAARHLPAATTKPPTTTPTTPPTPSTTAQPPLLTTQPMRAADGRNIRACLDGTCEVEVPVGTRIRFTTDHGPSTIVVSEIGPDGFVVTLLSDSGFSGNVGSGPGAGEFVRLNDVGIAGVAISGRSGVLRLVRG